VDGVSVNQAPTRDDKKGVESITCDKGAMGSWDYFHWNFNVNSLSQTKTTCTVNFVTRYTEDILNGTDPALQDELIPVTIDNDGTVHKANIQEKWYEYGNQQWANAVILEDESINYQNGEEIPEDNIESYFVWIPRYKYKIFDMGNYEGLTEVQNKPQIIDVVFGIDTTSDSDTTCKTPMESGESWNCSVGKYMTHPAFLAFGTNGMWVGKFETGYKGATTKEDAQKNENDPSKIQIKPNVYSWRGIQVANAYLNSYNYKRNLDSHMMKNTEWGAVIYLQHSKYGSSNERVNNNNAFITGYSAVNIPTCGFSLENEECNKTGTSPDITQPYNTAIGYLASITNNISGIYDMSGGASEVVMGVMSDSIGTPVSSRNIDYISNFIGPFSDSSHSTDSTKVEWTAADGGIPYPDSKYYDLYSFVSYNTIDSQYLFRRILGDATSELVYWWNYPQLLPKPHAPFLLRGNGYNYGYVANSLASNRTEGGAYDTMGYRIVLAI